MEPTQAANPLEQFVTDGQERRHLEYKESFDWKSQADVRAAVIRTILAMANTPDGGVIVIGVREDKRNQTFVPEGVRPEHLGRFTRDGVKAKVDEYADPYVDMQVDLVDHEGNTFVVIQVRPFDREPVICKREQGPHLLRGALYTRPPGTVESVPVRTHAEMRDIVDRAVELRLLPEMARIRSVCPAESGETTDPDRQAFDDQLGPF